MLMISSSILIVLGLIMVFSASSIHAIDTKGFALAVALRQFIFLIAAIPTAIVLARLPLERWELIAKFGLVISIVLVALVQIPGVGKEVNGNRNWIDLRVIDIQPGEFTKLFLILWASLLLARKERIQKMRFNAIALIAPGFIIVMAFIMRGGDLGTTAVIAAILAGLLFVSGVDAKKMGAVTAVISLLIAIAIATSDYRRARFHHAICLVRSPFLLFSSDKPLFEVTLPTAILQRQGDHR